MNIARLGCIFFVGTTKTIIGSIAESLRFAIGSKKTSAIEMNQVRWRISDPDLRLPGNFSKKLSHRGAIRKGSDV